MAMRDRIAKMVGSWVRVRHEGAHWSSRSDEEFEKKDKTPAKIAEGAQLVLPLDRVLSVVYWSGDQD